MIQNPHGSQKHASTHPDRRQRNGRKLAHIAEDSEDLIHQIQAQHSGKSVRMLSLSAFGGLRELIKLIRGCVTVLSKNVAYEFGLANVPAATLLALCTARVV